jgi:hypothetical protein
MVEVEWLVSLACRIPFFTLVVLEKIFGRDFVDDLIWDQAEQLGESGVSLDGMVGERDVDIRGYKVVAPACVDWSPFVVEPWASN